MGLLVGLPLRLLVGLPLGALGALGFGLAGLGASVLVDKERKKPLPFGKGLVLGALGLCRCLGLGLAFLYGKPPCQ